MGARLQPFHVWSALLIRGAARKSVDALVASGATVRTHHKARHIDGFEVIRSEAREALNIGVVPTSIWGADQAAAHTVVSQDDSIVSEAGNNDCGLRTCSAARGSCHRSLESINLARSAAHGAA